VPDPAVRTAAATDIARVTPLVDDALTMLRSLRGGDALLTTIGVPASIAADALASALCGAALLGTTTFVAELEGAVVGVAVVVTTGEGVDLLGVHTARPLRRRRVGTALLDTSRAYADASGERFEAIALPGDQTVKSLLESAGFKARLLRMSAER
jgi:GNAT superfamily N-acetyltransferase